MSEPSDSFLNRVSLALFSLVIVAVTCGAVTLTTEFVKFSYPFSAAALLGMVAGFIPALVICVIPFLAAKSIGSVSALNPSVRKWLAAAVVGLSFGLPLRWLGDSVIEGGWISQQSWAPAVPWVSAALGVVGIIGFSRVWVGDRFLGALAVGLSVAGATLVFMDILVLPNLYPTPHYGIRVIGQTLLTLSLWMFFTRRNTPPRFVAAGIGGTLAAAGIALWVFLPASMNMEMSFRGGVATNLTSLFVAESAPTTPVIEIIREEVPWVPAAKSQPRARAKHVVLLFVDTLRADAVSPAREAPGARKLVLKTDTPFLTKFMAEECSVFRRAYAQAPATHRSIPATFRSVEVWEDPLNSGTPLGTYLTQNGVSTFAVVNDYFVLPYYPASTALLEGFEDIGVYFPLAQDRVLDLAKTGFGKHLGAEPSFGWIHFLGPHLPGWNGKSLMDMKPRPRYREAVKWMDFAIKDLVDDLRNKGVLEDTAIIIASDHGEGLGDNGTWNHGPNVWNEELQVPLAVCLPGQNGVVIDRTVGNIDLQPTILDILGLPELETSRGRSLMPLLDDPQSAWNVPYYVENVNHSLAALIFGDQKLIFRAKSGAYSRYDLEKDPDENKNVFESSSKIDRELQMLMVHLNPGLAAKSLGDSDSAAVAAALKAWSGEEWDPKLNLTLGLAAQLDTPEIQAVVTQMWKGAEDDAIRFWIMRAMRTKKWLGELVIARFEAATELERVRFVRLVADAHLPMLDQKWVMKQIRSVPAQNDDLWVAWMRLVSAWPLPKDSWTDDVIAIVQKGGEFTSPAAQAASFWPLDALQAGKPSARLVAEMAKHHASKFPQARAASIRYLGLSADTKYVPQIRAALPSATIPFIVRRQAITALASLQGRAAVPLILEAIKADELVTVDALKAIGSTGDIATLKELKKGLHYGYNRFIDPEIERLERKK